MRTEPIAGLLLTQEGLYGGAALLQPVAGVRSWEEHCCREAAGWRVQSKAYRSEQRLPAWNATDFILHALLGGIHGVVLPILDSLQ